MFSPSTVVVTGRTLYRFVMRAAHNRNTVRVCEQWHETDANAEIAAKQVAVEWGGKRPLNVALVYPVPAHANGLNDAAGAP